MKLYVGGREIEIPKDEQGKVNVVEVRRQLNLPDNRMLIQQKSTGENVILPDKGQVLLNPYDRFIESGRAVRGRNS